VWRYQSTCPHPRHCRGIELGERRAQGVEARGAGNLSFLDGFGQRAGRAASTATATAAAPPGVVLCVADGIVRIVVHVVAREGLGGWLRRGIDRLIGVAAGEDKRCDPDRDEPASGGVRLVDAQGSRPSHAPQPELAISLNSGRFTLIRNAVRNTRLARPVTSDQTLGPPESCPQAAASSSPHTLLCLGI
jgi:hypothetical protein